MQASRLRTRLGEPVDAAGLRVFRVVFGLLLAVAVVRYGVNGWIESQFLEPTAFFPFFGLDHVRPLPPGAMVSLFVALGVASLALAAGLMHRLAALVVASGIAYTQLCDKTNYLNHYYLFVLLLLQLALMPIGRQHGTTVPRACYTLLRFQVGLVYLFAGLHKLQADWLLEAQPLKLWLLHAQDRFGGPAWLDAWWVAYTASWTGALFDLAIPFLLLWRRTRVLAYIAVVVFHALTAVLFPIGLFPWAMIAVATVFFAPDWPRRLRGRAASAADAAVPAHTPAPLGAGWFVLGVVWAVLQIAIPLRHLAYPGDDVWTEEAFRFSWKVMLVEKYGTAEFLVRDPLTGEERAHAPSVDLTFKQERMMATQPDMVLQYAHHLRDGYRAIHGRVPEVRVMCRVMLNGRASAPLIDPDVDLAQQPAGWRPKPWILPSPRD